MNRLLNVADIPLPIWYIPDDDGRGFTLSEIIAAEPRFGALLETARRDKSADADRLYCKYKRELSNLVGWYAENEELRYARAYEVGIIALSSAIGL